MKIARGLIFRDFDDLSQAIWSQNFGKFALFLKTFSENFVKFFFLISIFFVFSKKFCNNITFWKQYTNKHVAKVLKNSICKLNTDKKVFNSSCRLCIFKEKWRKKYVLSKYARQMQYLLDFFRTFFSKLKLAFLAIKRFFNAFFQNLIYLFRLSEKYF